MDPHLLNQAMADEAGQRGRGERVLRLGFMTKTGLALGKLAAGLFSGSPALLADGYHSLSDILTAALGWFTFRVANAPPDEDHHYGHGKYEALAAALVGGVLLATGVGVVWNSFRVQAPHYVAAEAIVAVVTALAAIAANEFLALHQRRSAQELGSPALDALARDSRSDALSSILVIVGVAGSLGGLGWLEPIVAGVIGLFVIWMGIESLRESVDVLTDRVADAGLRERIEEIARAVEGVEGVQAVAVHPLGSRMRVDMEISVDGDLSVRRGHAIAHAVEAAITHSEGPVVMVAVHVNPYERRKSLRE